MSGPVRLAIVGAGGIAQTHALAARRVPEVLPVAVADRDAAAAGALAEQLGGAGSPVRCTTDPGALADPSLVDLVVLATPPASHVDLACRFLQAGVAVLCEKPLALTGLETRRLAASAREGGALLTMASKFRFATDVVRARGFVASGAIGDVVRLENAFTARVDMAGRWNCDPAVSGGGVLIDNGTHSADIARFLLGPVTEVLAVEGLRVQGLPVEDTCVLLFRHAGGSLTSVELSWSTDRMTDRYLALIGTQGTVEVGWQASRIRTVGSPAAVDFGVGWNKLQALRDNLANVARALRGQEELVVSFADAAASVGVIEAGYRSLRDGGWVSAQD